MIKRTPHEWESIIGIQIIDADGWEQGTWRVPITAEEFIERSHSSTTRTFKNIREMLTVNYTESKPGYYCTRCGQRSRVDICEDAFCSGRCVKQKI